ncbi:7219_t:CDS:2 [Scutellospora calospora]|uniref:7219_t:CDS:1 n=1 Tax=Scutellospora calospora TaxID=85575 RepID=A0ACA9K560_9GLOM|nr:7219_t:CDS:2 [Scutellospora calospora]
MSSHISLVITGSRILTSDSIDPLPATIEIDKNGHISAIFSKISSFDSYTFLEKNQFIDAGNNVVMPGIVDTHVHLNEPGRTDWEGFETGTKAAAAGGVTTIIDMPLNSIPPTTTVNNLMQKTDAAKGKCWVDVGFYGGNDLVPLINAGVKGFKGFLIDSGVDEFPCVNEQDGQNSVFMFHAEMELVNGDNKSQEISDEILSCYDRFHQSRPQSLEINAITLISRLAKEYNTVRSHIVHLSAANAIDIIRKSKSDGVPLSVETCFHYLSLSAEEVPLGRTDFKCAPPVREKTNQEKLWQALLDGTIDFVVSDHSPCTLDLKFLDEKPEDRDFLKAWGGISTLQFGLPVLWTEAKKRGCSFHNLTTWLSKNTAKHVGLQEKKGDLKVGYDADIVIWDPEKTFEATPYMGRTFYGVVKQTIVRGNIVYNAENGGIIDTPYGDLLV